ncbi:uncharacterized protein N7473_012761 [Penicillium subrubescens]|nr:uncharacterized protein N7473_012761 [Penicillium subrubescens]KAJ5875414.1 hypothetical protein N7473_012761 [Penicillium subrubescens]
MASELEPIDIMDSDDSTSIKEEKPNESGLPPLESFTENTKTAATSKTHIPMIPSSKRGPKLRPGVWLSAGISRKYLVHDIPIAGVINEHGIPRPSLRGPDIWPAEDTIAEITRMAEANDLSAIQEAKSLFHLSGFQKNQLRDAYIWIALRQHEDGSFVMSKSARDRLVPDWRELLDSKHNAPPPTTLDLRQSGTAMASSHDLPMNLNEIFDRLDNQDAIIKSLSRQVESKYTAIGQLTQCIHAQVASNQHVVAGLRQAERAMEGPLGGCRQQ